MEVQFLLGAPHSAKASWGLTTPLKIVWGHPKLYAKGDKMKFYYVYILQLSNKKFYIGRSDNLKRRLHEHILGKDKTTKRFLPVRLVTYLAFNSKTKAVKFESYLKTGSGFAFRNKHLV